ncbi:lysophospholipid acyltransferase family protein [Raineya orbicola]|jgi:1-acyl-sn-glycerol-3-phosphate acyltransferase|uniref:Acyltransferase n=1 Tax=Raineya orbicola TaxID=2016530 RepID=A0A2N3IK00_9BACT|nr:lysophospholipid acyltransferase family protein [Raineya orbicola]PKQ70636.1 Acyltransferase [Raineya orbicola]
MKLAIKLPFIKKDSFGHLIPLKKLLISLIGSLTFPRLNWLNKTQVKGREILENLPAKGVLFVSNHQTYFADVITMLHIFCTVGSKITKNHRNPLYLLRPRSNVYFVAAEETMKSGLIPRLFAYVGAIKVKRTWREAGKAIQREVDLKDIENVGQALQDGWVITFPQGTTKAFAPGRKGTAHIIKEFKPVVVPVVINGFRRAFDKKGLFLKKTGVELSVTFKEPLFINYEDSAENILAQVMDAIEQSERFQFKFEDKIGLMGK